jgi:acylphosphatase
MPRTTNSLQGGKPQTSIRLLDRSPSETRLRIAAASVKLHTMVLHFLIQGRVQGVGFRWFVHREASELDLSGWVRNTEEGDVEVLASGKEADLAELRSSLRRGPRGARVDRLVEHQLDESEAAELSVFRIDGAW